MIDEMQYGTSVFIIISISDLMSVMRKSQRCSTNETQPNTRQTSKADPMFALHLIGVCILKFASALGMPVFFLWVLASTFTHLIVKQTSLLSYCL